VESVKVEEKVETADVEIPSDGHSGGGGDARLSADDVTGAVHGRIVRRRRRVLQLLRL
jgi:hypothetical protein